MGDSIEVLLANLLGLALYELPEAGGGGPPQGEVRAAQQQNQTRHQGACRGMWIWELFKGTVSPDGLRYCWHAWLDLSLRKIRGWL